MCSNNPHVQDFVRDLQSRCLSAHTLLSYKSDLEQYELFSAQHGTDILKANSDHIRNFIVYLQSKELKASSISRKVSCIKEFYRYHASNENILKDPTIRIRTPRYQRPIPKFFTPGQIRLLLETPDENTYAGLRDKTILELLYSSGLRVSELCELRSRDVNLNQGMITVIGKGGYYRNIPVTKPALRLMKRYDDVRVSGCDMFFVEKKGRPYNRIQIYQMLKKYCNRAGIPELSPHAIRHSFATHMVENECNLIILSKILGHKNINTTQHYTHLDMRIVTNEFHRGHPRDASD